MLSGGSKYFFCTTMMIRCNVPVADLGQDREFRARNGSAERISGLLALEASAVCLLVVESNIACMLRTFPVT
jgi:hypothetical protein